MELELIHEKVQLILPSSHIKYAWNLYTPKTINNVLIWGYASRHYDDYKSEIEYFNSQIGIIQPECEKYGILAVSIFLPRSSNNLKYPEYKYTPQMMSPETMLDNQKNVPEFFRRPDLEVLKVLEILKSNMISKQIQVPDKFLIGGVSSGANFANRFSLLYPNLIKGSTLFCAGDFAYPVNTLKGIDIDYPYGTSNLSHISSISFDQNEFKTIPHYIYVGSLETKGPLEWELYFPNQIEKYKTLVGDNTIERTQRYAKFLKLNGNPVSLRIEPNVGHKIEKGVFDDGFGFLTKFD